MHVVLDVVAVPIQLECLLSFCDMHASPAGLHLHIAVRRYLQLLRAWLHPNDVVSFQLREHR